MTINEKEVTRTWTLVAVFLVMCLWNLVIAIDSTSLSVALPTIATDLHAASNEVFWCGTSFVLCSAAFQPIFAIFSTNFGRKLVIIVGLVLFTVGALVCGLSHHISVLILGRCIQGIGGGGLTTMSYVVMADLLSMQQRAKALALISLTWLVGTSVGPCLGGVFTENVTWRWNFWFNLPFCGICLVMVLFFFPSQHDLHISISVRLRRIDWFGAAMFVASLISFLVAISWGGTMYAWNSWRTLVPLIMGIAGFAVWIAYSYYWCSNPMISLQILDNRTSVISYFSNVVQGIAQFGVLFYLPLYFQGVKSYSPIISGVGLIPQCLGAGLASAVAGVMIGKTHHAKPFVLGGWTLYSIGLGLLVLLGPSTTSTQWIFISIPCGLGLGMLFSSVSLATQAAAEAASRPGADVAKIKGMAAALNPFFRTLGNAFGIVIGQAALENELKRRLGIAFAQDAGGLIEAIKNLPSDSAQEASLVAAFGGSLRTVWWIFFGMAAFCLVLTLFTKDVPCQRGVGGASELVGVRGQSDSDSASNKSGRTPIAV